MILNCLNRFRYTTNAYTANKVCVIDITCGLSSMLTSFAMYLCVECLVCVEVWQALSLNKHKGNENYDVKAD